MQVLNLHGTVFVLNVHGAVACACHQNVSLTGSITQRNDTDHTRSYDTRACTSQR